MKHLSLSLNHGVLAALVNFGLVMAIYLIDINLMVAWWFSLIALMIVPVFMFMSGTAARKADGGVLSFGSGFQVVLITAVVTQFLSALLTWVLYTVIAPELPGILTDLVMEKTAGVMETFGVPAEIAKTQMEELETTLPESYKLSGLMKNSGYGLLMWAVVSLIVAAIVKRKPQSDFA
ncbi:MAG: DUF4199 domain-containing protein [Bacteroidetes bacterium]|nr:DUF4199 domain-containing protein [Bacteroidota bacterium]MDA0904383.1 DUF4199 domain-containing protein [Bacteroidota bacterium]MDA1243044.1 DUF4199 domain-containing protein [Bacteroidota bacterium]